MAEHFDPMIDDLGRHLFEVGARDHKAFIDKAFEERAGGRGRSDLGWASDYDPGHPSLLALQVCFAATSDMRYQRGRSWR